MTAQHPTPKRFRFRFSIRTLVIFVTLVCVYFALWEVTKRHGVPGVPPMDRPVKRDFSKMRENSNVRLFDASTPVPLIVVEVENDWDAWAEHQMQLMPRLFVDPPPAFVGPPPTRTSYYLWLFGPRIRLGCTRSWE